MIISHEHRFVFIEVPLTGTTAIARELCASYGGEEILGKHSHLSEFLRVATADQKSYRVAAGVRHPLDRLLSYFTKLVNNHKGAFTDPERFEKNGGWVTEADRERFAFIEKTGGDFGAYLRHFHSGSRPSISQYNWGRRQYDYVIRFESLDEDFHNFLRAVGIEPVRDLPAANVTAGRSRDFFSAYPEDLRKHMRNVYGPLSKEWGYDFPNIWGADGIPVWSRLQYSLINTVGRFSTQMLNLTPRDYQRVRVGINRSDG
ncbi:MAG: hypothetical protein ACI8X5_000294 [Planctomycetota bacterium]|jgi:hypothetical protein